MRAAVQYIVSKTYKPILVRYLSKTRTYSWRGINLEITPGIFHPGFFFSTRILLRYILDKDLNNKTVLELGAGSGLLSIYTAKQGATVLATDISPSVIACLSRNREKNNVSFEIEQSDLFDKIGKRKFDMVLINPPYYKKIPNSYEDYAWYCGENGEYFQKLFLQLQDYMHADTEVLMVLCDGCDIDMIRLLAKNSGFEMHCMQTVNKLIEDNYIFRIEPQDTPGTTFEHIYHTVRNSEKRLYTDEEVLALPRVSTLHVHRNEWRFRKASSDKLITYLARKKRGLEILEIGCGNGWLCHQLATRLPAEVTGIDTHGYEINQATRVFTGIPHLKFIYGEANSISFGQKKFDIIIFAASIQYFPSFAAITHNALDLLRPGGEIHILDSWFYSPEQAQQAHQRSSAYFSQLGFEEMSRHYYHPTLASLQEFDHRILYNPASPLNKLLNRQKPFYWLMIKSDK